MANDTTDEQPRIEAFGEPAAGAADPTPQARFILSAVQTFFLGGIFVFCLLGAFYFAASILLPIFLALLLKFVLHPLVRTAQRAHIHSSISSVIIIIVLFTGIFGIGMAVSGPLGDWSKRIINALPEIQQQLGGFKEHITGVKNALTHAENIMPGTDAKPPVVVAMRGTTLEDRVLNSTGRLVGGFFETVIFLLFLLVSGDTFLRRLVEVLPRFRDKKHAVAISQQIENDLSAYLMTITVTNFALGAVTGIAMWFCHLENPLLWGMLAFTLNYVPLIGPITMLVILSLVGLLSFSVPMGLLPAGVFLIIHLAESQIITPLILARRFTLNPVMIMLSIIFWFWMWGIMGAILATPILAVIKIICDHIDPLKPIGHMVEGDVPLESDAAQNEANA